jgi:hypothetical protein
MKVEPIERGQRPVNIAIFSNTGREGDVRPAISHGLGGDRCGEPVEGILGAGTFTCEAAIK